MMTAIVQSMKNPPCLNLEAGAVRSSVGDQVEERFCRMAERARLGVEQPNLALDVQLLDRDLADGARLDVLAHAHPGEEGDALASLHEAADRLQRRHLDVHVQRHLV